MKLIDHVLKIRGLIARAISNRFERLGLTDNPDSPEPSLTEDDRHLRSHLKSIVDYHATITQNYAEAQTLAINECTFTLFNRLAALKVMEDKGFFPPVVARYTENGGKSLAHNAWLEDHPEARAYEREGLLPFFIDRFKEESETFPLFGESHPYALMPRADELNEIIDAFNAVAEDSDCGKDIWRGDDILGWLYENFNAVEKTQLKESGEKTEYDKVSLQSQVYTPQWVVKFLVDNTVGKMYLEMFPDSPICDIENEDGTKKYLIANRPTERLRNVKPLEEWRIIDPACGSGNFLIYTMSLLFDLYLDQAENFGCDYSRRDIPAMIVENNLYGVDLDERAVQLSQIALRIKAREIGGRRARLPKHTNVVCSNFILPDYEQVRHMVEWSDWDKQKADTVEKVWNDLAQASKFGSLVRVEQPLRELVEAQSIAKEGLFAGENETSLFNFRRNAIDSIREQFARYVSVDNYTSTKVEDALTFLDILSQQFDVAVANPPYTDSGDFGPELKTFIANNYKKPFNVGVNLYSTFIRRCYELVENKGKIGMVNPPTYMFIKSFEDTRKLILENTSIDIFVHWGYLGMFSPSARVDSCMFVLSKDNTTSESVFIKLDDLYEGHRKNVLDTVYQDICEGRENSRVYRLPQDKLRQIKSWPFIYWISDDFRKKFAGESLEDVADPKVGMNSGGNEQFVRFHWEIQDANRWKHYAKGGPYCKWYGNNWTLIDWDNNGEAIKNAPKSIMRNQDFYFREGITYSASGSKGVSFRYLEPGGLFDVGGSCIFYKHGVIENEVLLAILNTSLITYIADCLNPTVNIQVGDMQRFPIAQKEQNDLLHDLAQQNITIKKQLCKFSLIEPLFEKSPIQPGNLSAKECIASYYVYENGLMTQVLLNEAIINREVFDIYELSDNDRKMVLDKEGIPVGDLPVSQIAKNNYLQWLQLNKEFSASEELIAHINSLPISEEQPRLEFDRLYQKNYDWEEFCIQNTVNSIEAWYQFTVAKTLPAQRTQVLAFELITDVIRALLEKDDDGVMPLVDRTGEGLVADRIQQEMIERGYTGAQFSQIVALLGMPLDRYLRDKFFQQLSDHLNLFMYLPKTPFIWHLTSGPLHAMELYVSIYKWNRNTLSRVKSVYCANRENALRDRLATLSQSADPSAQGEAADIRAQLRELAEFVDKLDALLASSYDPKLDDGVGKNIAPLQKAGLLSYAVLKESGGKKSQLNKFLNADW